MPGHTQRIDTVRGGSSPAAATPSRLGKYQIIESIGEGGFGIVYKGFDPFIKRNVAIKTCTSPDQELRQRYFREAEIAGRLDHPNIVRIFDFGIDSDTPYLVQEFLAGCDLDEKIAGHDFIPFPERLLCLIHVARGLAYAHAQGVIHRDIKPANIRILEDGTAKIMDFGVAMLLNTETRLTREGMAVGTAAYLAPEQIEGKTTDRRTDVFSFGVLAYELVTGYRPFERETISATLYAILNDDPKPIGLPSHACPDALRQLIERCLNKNPPLRFAGFDNIIGILDRLRREMRSDSSRRDYNRELREVSTSTSTTFHAGDESTAESKKFDPQLDHGWAPRAASRRRHWLRIGIPISVLATLACVYAILVHQGLLPRPTDSTELLAVSTGTVMEAEDPAEDIASTETRESSDESIEIDPGPEVKAAVEGDAVRAEAEIPEPTEEAAPESAAVEPPSPVVEKATLLLATGWHAAITAKIDGGEAMSLTRTRSRRLEPGRHTVRYALVTPDYKDSQTVRVDLASGEERTLASPLGRPGQLSVQASLGSPQGLMRLDGNTIGQSPIRSQRLAPGQHQIQVFAKDHPTIALANAVIEVRSGRETVVTFDLTGQRELAVRYRPGSRQGDPR